MAIAGAATEALPDYAELGFKSIYLGDEAFVYPDRFSLEGRPIRKVRQSVTRLAKAGYRVELPEERLEAAFDENSVLQLTPELVGATETRVSGIIGKHIDLTLGADGEPHITYSPVTITQWQPEVRSY